MSKTPIGENDSEAYQEAADKVTADPDNEVWVVESARGDSDDFRVDAVLPTYEDAQAYMEDKRTFTENCPIDSPNNLCRNTIRFRYGSRDSPTKMFEEWPPKSQTD